MSEFIEVPDIVLAPYKRFQELNRLQQLVVASATIGTPLVVASLEYNANDSSAQLALQLNNLEGSFEQQIHEAAPNNPDTYEVVATSRPLTNQAITIATLNSGKQPTHIGIMEGMITTGLSPFVTLTVAFGGISMYNKVRKAFENRKNNKVSQQINELNDKFNNSPSQ